MTNTKIKFNVDINPLDEIVGTPLKPNFDYNGLETLLDHQGSGVQRTFIYLYLKGLRCIVKNIDMKKRESGDYYLFREYYLLN